MASYIRGKENTILYLKSHFPKGSTCLDVGVCDGVWNLLLEDWFVMDGIEAWKPNIYKYRLFDRYRNIYCKDVIGFEYPRNYDVIIFGDVLEHMTVEEAQQVLEYAKTKATEIIVAVPFGYEQDALGGNTYEVHKQPDLTPEIFNERYPGFTPIYMWDGVYCYYKLASTPADPVYALTYANREIADVILTRERSTEDYLKLMRGCFDYILALRMFGKDCNEAPNVVHYMKNLKDLITEGTIPSYHRFWAMYYDMLKEIKAPKEELHEAILGRLNADNIEFSKYLINTEKEFYNQVNEYIYASFELYKLGYINEARIYNNKVLSIDPTNETALNNKPYFEVQS